MRKIRIGVLGPSEIAFRRFMPALLKNSHFDYVGLAVANELEWFGDLVPNRDLTILNQEYEKAEKFREQYGGHIFQSYEELLSSNIDAVYIPLPPALHFKWAKLALERHKHVFVEKPSTTQLVMSKELVDLAEKNGLALHENYMFVFHTQINSIKSIIESDEFGKIRLIRIAFGFPFRGKHDFRYWKKLGGGALLDCGGYTLKLGSIMLGPDTEVVSAELNYEEDFDVDIFGTVTMKNKNGLVAQISFGMDNTYKNELEIWGNKKRLYTNRIFTAPAGYTPEVILESQDKSEKIVLDSDDTFLKSIDHFCSCIHNENIRFLTYQEIIRQSYLVDKVLTLTGE